MNSEAIQETTMSETETDQGDRDYHWNCPGCSVTIRGGSISEVEAESDDHLREDHDTTLGEYKQNGGIPDGET